MFYVYEYYIVNTGEIFYVGKGTKRRYKELHNRNTYFNNVYNKYKCDVRFIAENLTNEEACDLEIKRIKELRGLGLAKCNVGDGGEGFASGDKNPMYGKGFKGKDNPMYGRTREKHPNSKLFSVTYICGEHETLLAKECERKFGMAFDRIRSHGGIIHYKKSSKNSIYEGTIIKLITKPVTTIENTSKDGSE